MTIQDFTPDVTPSSIGWPRTTEVFYDNEDQSTSLWATIAEAQGNPDNQVALASLNGEAPRLILPSDPESFASESFAQAMREAVRVAYEIGASR